MVNQTHPHRTQPALLDTTAQVIQKYPFILWGISLVLVLLLGGMALKKLIYPGPIEPIEPELAAAPVKPQSPELAEKDLNLLLFGAVALGCAAGSILISQRIEQPKSQPKLQSKSQPKSKQRAMLSHSPVSEKRQPPAKATRRSSPSMRRKKVGAVPVQRSHGATATVLPMEPVQMRQPGYTTAPVVIEPVVTVVPENESHPLDWGEANLADMMDIRKRKPLSSLL
ncbi:MAG TPA: hypothetical protein V6D16_12345 [Candidatus Obscuribacterales bacterium]